MIVAVRIPDLCLRVALLVARRPVDIPIALAPMPGAPQVLGPCTPAAAAQGVRAGIALGEALARCPTLELVPADPAAVARASERAVSGLEGIGAAVEIVGGPEAGEWCFAAQGLMRLYGGLDGVLRQARAALWVGADGRIGASRSRFVALQAAREAAPRATLVVASGEERAFVASLPIERLPLDAHALRALDGLGIHRTAQLAALPRAAVLDRFGTAGLHAWELARVEADEPLRPRVPPEPVEAAMDFPDQVGALPALEDATRILLRELASACGARGRAIRTLTLRAALDGGGSWTHTLTLREASVDPERLALAALPHLARIAAPVERIAIVADASGTLDGQQLALISLGEEERRRRAEEAARQAQAAHGHDAVERLVELEPWSRLPERRWALVPYTGSAHLAPST